MSDALPGEMTRPPLMLSRRVTRVCLRSGDDDWFSIDSTDAWLQQRYQPLNVPVCVVLSGGDEFVPWTQDEVLAFWRRCERVQPRVSPVIMLEDADHALTSEKHQSQFVDAVMRFLEKLKDV